MRVGRVEARRAARDERARGGGQEHREGEGGRHGAAPQARGRLGCWASSPTRRGFRPPFLFICCGPTCQGEPAVWWFYGVAVSTQDSESCDPGSNPGRTSFCRLLWLCLCCGVLCGVLCGGVLCGGAAGSLEPEARRASVVPAVFWHLCSSRAPKSLESVRESRRCPGAARARFSSPHPPLPLESPAAVPTSTAAG